MGEGTKISNGTNRFTVSTVNPDHLSNGMPLSTEKRNSHTVTSISSNNSAISGWEQLTM